MAYQISLSDEEYAALAEIAKNQGKSLIVILHEAISQYTASGMGGSYIYPTGEPTTPEEDAEEEAIAQHIGPQKPWLSEMVIEDRGPR
jgi:hypothetical protein